MTIEIYWNDLTAEKQQELLNALGEIGNYDVFPIAVLEFEEELSHGLQRNTAASKSGAAFSSTGEFWISPTSAPRARFFARLRVNPTDGVKPATGANVAATCAAKKGRGKAASAELNRFEIRGACSLAIPLSPGGPSPVCRPGWQA